MNNKEIYDDLATIKGAIEKLQWKISEEKKEPEEKGKISKYFNETETTVSSTGARLGIENKPNKEEKKNILYTAQRMDEVRELLGVPLTVLSWFRCEKLNNAVKGSKTSAHRVGMAVDVHSTKMTAKEIYEKFKKSKLSFDQLIYYPKSNFVHFGFKLDKSKERKQAWINK